MFVFSKIKDGEDVELIILNEETMSTLLACYMRMGWIAVYPDLETMAFRFEIRNDSKFTLSKDILSNIDNWLYVDKGRHENETLYLMVITDLCYYMIDHVGLELDFMRVPTWIKTASDHLKRLFINTFFHESFKKLETTNKSMLDEIQELCNQIKIQSKLEEIGKYLDMPLFSLIVLE